ncbi:MAG: hypothetical protein CML19_09915 [Pusillimonas sp.]|nr:hypothetical protein [Pusillimonas sp.]
MPQGMESDLLAQIRKSNTTFSSKLTTVRLEKPRATMLEIRPRDVGTDTEGWAVGPEEIPVETLEEAIILGMEIQARECPR